AGREHAAGDVDLGRVEAPGADAAEQVGVAELVLAGDDVLDVAEGPVEGQQPVGHAGVDHAGQRVVPQVLLVDRAVGLDVAAGRILAHEVARGAPADAGGLHAPVGGQVGRAEGQTLHAGRGRADLLHVGHAAGRLEDGVQEDRAVEPGPGLELGDETV